MIAELVLCGRVMPLSWVLTSLVGAHLTRLPRMLSVPWLPSTGLSWRLEAALPEWIRARAIPVFPTRVSWPASIHPLCVMDRLGPAGEYTTLPVALQPSDVALQGSFTIYLGANRGRGQAKPTLTVPLRLHWLLIAYILRRSYTAGDLETRRFGELGRVMGPRYAHTGFTVPLVTSPHFCCAIQSLGSSRWQGLGIACSNVLGIIVYFGLYIHNTGPRCIRHSHRGPIPRLYASNGH